MIDTHAHLDFPQFDSDRDRLIEECRDHGVEFIVNIGVDMKSSRASIELAEKYDFIFAAVGFHPHDSKDLDDSKLKEIEIMAAHPKVVAIGEIGLDYYRNLSPADIQKKAFIQQLELAGSLKLPVILHIRQAMKDCYDILKKSPVKRGILHAFPGDKNEALEGVAMGFHIAFGGPITYPKSRGPETAAAVPLSRIVVETDCPYLSPQAHRGKRNRPDNVKYVIEKLAEVFPRYSYRDIERITSRNAAELLVLPLADPPKIIYEIGDSVYINLTNRCTNNCRFCLRQNRMRVAGHNLLLDHEPEFDEIILELDKLSDYREIVFCGIGEPTLRADLMLEIARKLKSKNVPIRLNTNGQGSLINKTDLPRKLRGLIDIVSVSLNAQDSRTYSEICRPQFGESAYAAMLKFAGGCRALGVETIFSVVDLPEVDLAACKKIADSMNIPLRVRKYVDRSS